MVPELLPIKLLIAASAIIAAQAAATAIIRGFKPGFFVGLDVC